MTNKTRIGIIGAGWWAADYHIPGILEEAEAELVAVCDLHEGRLADVKQAYQINKTYPDYRDMLQNEALDGAIIVTPHATHYQIASDCLDHGLHILVEKPMTLTARDARDLVQRASAAHLEIMVGYTSHYYGHSRQVRRLIQDGALGQIQYVTSSYASDMSKFLGGNVSPENPPTHFKVHGPSENYNRPEMLGGGQGHLQLTHPIGLMFFVTGLRAQQVQAVMSNQGLKVDLVDAFSVRFEEDALGLVGGTGNSGANYRNALSIYGTEGCYIADSLGHISILHDKKGKELPLDPQAPPDHRYTTTHNFIEVIQGKNENFASGEIGWRAVELLDAAYRSAGQNGQPIKVEDLYR